MTIPSRLRLKCAAALLVMGAGGCAQFDPDNTRRQARDALEPLVAPVTEARRTRRTLAAELQLADAQHHALTSAPAMQHAYIRLNVDTASAVQAAALPNPVLEVSSLALSPGSGRERRFWIVTSLTSLLTLRARRDGLAAARLAAMYELGNVAQQTLAAAEAAWLKLVAAREHAALAQTHAQTEALAAKLASQFADAGNVTAGYLATVRAAAGHARIDALVRKAAVTDARGELADLLGLDAGGGWTVPASLPMPLSETPTPTGTRFDLAVAEANLVAARASKRAARVAGVVDLNVGWERERGPSDRASGPVAEAELPLFDQGTPERAIASGALAVAQLQVRTVQRQISNAMYAARQKGHLARQRYDTVTGVMLPGRIAATRAAQAEANFMLTGPFELIKTKQSELTAHAARIDALLDYWLANAEPARAAGQPLALPATPELPRDGEERGHQPQPHTTQQDVHHQHPSDEHREHRPERPVIPAPATPARQAPNPSPAPQGMPASPDQPAHREQPHAHH